MDDVFLHETFHVLESQMSLTLESFFFLFFFFNVFLTVFTSLLCRRDLVLHEHPGFEYTNIFPKEPFGVEERFLKHLKC